MRRWPRQVVHVAHGAESAVDDEVGEGDKDGDSDARERAAPAHGKRERDGQYGHDDGDKRPREFVPECDAQAHGVESALSQGRRCSAGARRSSFPGLLLLLGEVARVFMDLREGGLFEFSIFGNGASFHVALPAILEAPGMVCRVPVDTGGNNAPGEREGGGVELEDERLANSLRSGSKNW